MNTNLQKVNILRNTIKINLESIFNFKFFVNLVLISLLALALLTQSSFAQIELNTSTYTWSNKNFLSSINKERAKKKLTTLKENDELNRLAKLRLDDMINNNYFAHESPTGNSIDELLLTSSYNYEWRGENLAYGEFESEGDVTKSWMKSKWHKYNILYPNFSEVGTAYAVADFKSGKYLVVVQVFGKEIKNNNLAKK